MVAYNLAGLDPKAWSGERFELKLTVTAETIKSIFKFVKVQEKYWRMVIPPELYDKMGINKDTYYLIFYSPENMEMVVFLIPFSEVVKFYNFSIPPEEDTEKKKPKGKSGLIYELSARGYLTSVLRNVWRIRNRKKNKVYYGISIPPEVASAMSLSDTTRYILRYSVEAGVLILEIRDILGGGMGAREKLPEKEEVEMEV